MANKCKLLPLNDQVVIRRFAETVSKGGIHIPDSAQKKSRRGTVVACGPGSRIDGNVEGRRLPLYVEVGETVMFDQYAGREVEIDGETFVVVSESEILTIVKE
jgi:chaperonin GroES